MTKPHPENVNASKVRNPKWTGDKYEYAVVVSRGEPRRTDKQMFDAVHEQATRYLVLYEPHVFSVGAVAQAMALIARDHIFRQGAQGVALTRAHLVRYVEVAANPLQEAAQWRP